MIKLARVIALITCLGAMVAVAVPASASQASPGAQLWASQYNAPGSTEDGAWSMAVSPDGTRVFVTGHSTGTNTGTDYSTIAYSAATGAQLWARQYNGPGNSYDQAQSVAVSPDGTRVFVTGYSTGTSSGEDYATVAYSAATGDQLWAKRYNGPANAMDEANSVRVSPDGRKVFVTGISAGATSPDYATVGYNAATGAKLWVKRYDGPAKQSDRAWSLAVSPDGTKAYVTGSSTGTKSGGDYTTVAYNAATGAQLWLKRYNGPANSSDSAYSVAVSPDGRKVVVTGASTGIYYPDGSEKGFDYATVAYNASTGAQLWAKRYNGPAKDYDAARSVAVGPASSVVYVTGESTGTSSGSDYATVAYNAATGARLWVTRYNGQANGIDAASSVAVSPDGQTVYVTGESTEIPPTPAQSYEGYATFAYTAATGVPLWASRYNGTGIGYNYAASIAVSPATGTVYVTGLSDGNDASGGSAAATLAYQG